MEGDVRAIHFRVGDRVRFRPLGRWAGFPRWLDVAGRVVAIERNGFGRVNYRVVLDAPVERTMEYRPHAKKARAAVETCQALEALLEDLWPEGAEGPEQF